MMVNSFYSVSALVNLITSLALSVFVLSRNHKLPLNRAFFYFASSVAFWSFFYFLWQIAADKAHALFWCRALMAGAVFIPSTFFHLSAVLFKIFPKYKRIVYGGYLASVAFLIADASDLLVKDVAPRFSLPYCPSAGSFFVLFLMFFTGMIILAHVLMLSYYRYFSDIKKAQVKYIFLATFVGFAGGMTNFPLWFGAPVLPVGNILVSVFIFLIALAVIKYRLMDIRLAVSNAVIFLCVYAVVLGVPFYAYLLGYQLIPLIAMGVLATAGPIVFSLLRRQARERILEEQRRYQFTLLQATKGLARLKTSEAIARTIARIIYAAMGLKSVAVFLKQEDVFRLVETMGQSGVGETEVSAASLLEGRFNESGVYFLEDPCACLVMPVKREEKFFALLVLGEKANDTLFSEDDINVLNIIAVNLALAMENAMYLEAETARIQEEGAQIRRESLDVLVGTMAHEIDNPLSFVMGEADFLREIIGSGRLEIPQKELALITRSCGQIMAGVQRVSNIIRAVEQYSKKQTGEMVPVLIDQMLVPLQALLLLHRKKYRGVELIEDIEKGLPAVLGQVVLIEEVILNLVKNGLHAAQKQNPGGGGKLKLKIFRENDDVVIDITDNGYGIEPGILKHLFQVPTTTKGSSEGTGLGLYHVRRVVDMIKGRVRAESEGRGRGARFVVTLPAYKGEVSGQGESSQRVF